MSVYRVRQLYIIIINHTRQFLILLYTEKSLPLQKYHRIFNKFCRMGANFSQPVDKENLV